MTWVKITDDYANHPKIAAAGPHAIALWLAGLAYCNRNLTDGYIPLAAAETLIHWRYADDDGRIWTLGIHSGHQGIDITCESAINRLVDVGLWEVAPGGYQVHDYADYQPLKAQIIELREHRSRAGRKGANTTNAKRQA